DVLSIQAAPIEFVKREFPGLSLARILKFSNTRQKKQLKIGDYLYLLEIDRTEYHDGSVDYELEVELDDAGRVEIVEDGLRRLFGKLDIPFSTQAKSKYERALTHAGLM
ncbi:hypothetical protein KKA00_02620, partial [bacterium]|nr:hypothetical protein [bacterium]